MEKIYDSFGVKRIQKNDERKTKDIECYCCNKIADIELYFTKKIKGKHNKAKKGIKRIYLCKRHYNDLKNIINYFDLK